MINRSELGDVENVSIVRKLAQFVGVERFRVIGKTERLEAVEVGGVELLEGANERLHIELCVDIVLANVSNADFDLVAKLGGFLFGFRNTSFIAVG